MSNGTLHIGKRKIKVSGLKIDFGLEDLTGPALDALAKDFGIARDDTIRFQRALDLWDAVKIGTDFATLVLAIDAAWKDGELEVDECIALFAHYGYATRVFFEHMTPTSWCRLRNVDKDCWQLVAQGASSTQKISISADQASPAWIQTRARRASEQTPEVTMAEADQAFADLAELVK